MTNQISTMFLSDVSVVDHAFIDNKGKIIGGSFNPCFLVSGEIDPQEKVVVDFSTVKKSFKEIIDHKETGFDHKLWIIEGWSDCEVIETEVTADSGNKYNSLYIMSPVVSLCVPVNAVKRVHISNLNMSSFDYYKHEDVAVWFNYYLQTEMQNRYPNINIKIETEITENMHHIFKSNPNRSDLIRFRYTHGLKDSTSWGCQNIAHGHLSYMFVEYDPSAATTINKLMIKDIVNQQLEHIAQELHNVVFINKENLIDNSDNQLSYETKRGLFSELLSLDDINTVVLETETTIEFIVEYIKQTFDPSFVKLYGIKTLYVSEGLSKGAMVYF